MPDPAPAAAVRAAAPGLRVWLARAHRYLGLPLGAVFVVWFASGIVMLFTGGMPELTDEARRARRPPLDLARVALTPQAAARRAHLSPTPRRASLRTVLGRPAYRFDGVTVFADTGARLGMVGPAAAAAVVSRFTGAPPPAVTYVETLDEPDQWTLVVPDRLPLHRFRVANGAGAVVYVSPRTAEVAMATTRRSRTLAWIGAIPHWFYVRALRARPALWAGVVVWTATLGSLVALLGLALGVTQFGWRRAAGPAPPPPIRVRPRRIPYVGWMRWHYVTGVLFGAVTFTWVGSGLLSMEPYAWTRARGLDLPRDVLAGGPLDLAHFPAFDPARWDEVLDGRAVQEIELLRLPDAAGYVVRLADGSAPGRQPAAAARRPAGARPVTARAAPADRLLLDAATLTVRDRPFSAPSLLAALTAAAPGTPIAASTLLTAHDAYYYPRGRPAPLPVLRVRFADPMATWAYVDPALGQVRATVHRLARVERWLFNGLHSFDFAVWRDRPPLRRTVLILLSLGGLASSGIGLAVGCGRVRRVLGRWRARRRGRAAGTGS